MLRRKTARFAERARSRQRRALQHAEQGELKLAVLAFRMALRDATRLVQREPGNVQHVRLYAAIHYNLCMTHIRLGNGPEATSSCRSAVYTYHQIVDFTFFADPEWNAPPRFADLRGEVRQGLDNEALAAIDEFVLYWVDAAARLAWLLAKYGSHEALASGRRTRRYVGLDPMAESILLREDVLAIVGQLRGGTYLTDDDHQRVRRLCEQTRDVLIRRYPPFQG